MGQALMDYKRFTNYTPQQTTWVFVQRGVGLANCFMESWPLNLTNDAVEVRFDASAICTSDVKNIMYPYQRSRIVGKADATHTFGDVGFDIAGQGIVNGHEATFTVTRVGNDVENFRPGQRGILQADLREYKDGQAAGYRINGAFRGLGIWGPVLKNYLIKLGRDIGYAEAALIEGPTCVYASHDVGPVRDADKVVWLNGVGGPMGIMHTEEILLRRKQGKYKGIQALVVSDVNPSRLDAYVKRFERELSNLGIRLMAFDPTKTGKEAGLPEGGDFKDLKVDYYIELAPCAEITLKNLVALRDDAVINVYASYSQGTGDVTLDNGSQTTLKACHEANRTCTGMINGRHFTITGNSGSSVEHMRTVLKRLEDRLIVTDHFAAAVTGYKSLKQAIDAQDKKRYNGKIVVFNQIPDLPLMGIEQLAHLPVEWGDIMADIKRGRFTRQVEDVLLEHCLANGGRVF